MCSREFLPYLPDFDLMPTALVDDIHFCGDKVNESFKVYHKPRNPIVSRDLSQLLIII